ncbi:MAG: PKD domain-containing protein [Verrucomicrobia bacterium]|nr:PKD domain-containing protein [Verrucomicrobiota bacterium]
MITVGFHGNTAGTSAAGNDIPTADVPSWGSTTFDGVTGIFALLPFDNQRPRPEFTQAVNGGVLSVDANGTQSASAVIEALWDFGDGQTGSGLETSHSYAAPGRYLVGVTVINEEGLRASTHRWVEISEVTLFRQSSFPN